MAGFVQDLWQSVFVPGPTPALMVATNATFTALQALLLVLAITTYSVHFIILSFLSAGLWWSIIWFSRELQLAQKREAEERKERKRLRGKRGRGKGTSSDELEDDMDAGDDMKTGSDTGTGTGTETETETETETGSGVLMARMKMEKASEVDGPGPRDMGRDYGGHGTGYLSTRGNVSIPASADKGRNTTEASVPIGSTSGLASPGQTTGTGSQARLRPEQVDALRKRWSSSEGGELSTDSEWERVDEGR